MLIILYFHCFKPTNAGVGFTNVRNQWRRDYGGQSGWTAVNAYHGQALSRRERRQINEKMGHSGDLHRHASILVFVREARVKHCTWDGRFGSFLIQDHIGTDIIKTNTRKIKIIKKNQSDRKQPHENNRGCQYQSIIGHDVYEREKVIYVTLTEVEEWQFILIALCYPARKKKN